MPYTYMLHCADGSFYTGWTTDLEARLKTHNEGKGARYTRSRLPVRLVYWEEHPDRNQAQRGEAAIRRLKRAEKEKLINGKASSHFQGGLKTGIDPDCPFCDPGKRVVAENGTVIAIEDRHPVSPGHLLVIPRRHTPDYFSMTPREARDAEKLLRCLRNKIQESDPAVEGFNVGINCGEAAGQTVMHAHIHLIPRRKGDAPDPRGGVRGVIPGKMSY